MGVEVLMVGVLVWPAPTDDMGLGRPVLGELSMAVEGKGVVQYITFVLEYKLSYSYWLVYFAPNPT